MYRFALRPRWLAAHVGFAALVVVLVLLGQWQLRRLEERKDANALVKGRMAEAPVPLEALVGPAAGSELIGPTEYRRVRAQGVYDVGGEVRLRARQLEGRPGEDLLTPLVLADGRALVVDRGWVPTDVTGRPELEGSRPPPGAVEVVGLVRATQVRKGFGAKDPPTGRLAEISRVDLDRLQAQFRRRLVPVWVQLMEQSPAQPDDRPVPPPPPDLGEGPHLSYAIQWFCFAGMAVAAWVVVVRQAARRRAGGARLPVTPVEAA